MSASLDVRSVRTHERMAQLMGYILHDEDEYVLPNGPWTMDPATHRMLAAPLVHTQMLTSVENAASEMRALSERRVMRSGARVEGYHVLQDFDGTEVRSQWLAHDIGIQFMREALPGFQCVLATHVTTPKVHNHILVNAVGVEGDLVRKLLVPRDGPRNAVWNVLDTRTKEIVRGRGLEVPIVLKARTGDWEGRHWAACQPLEPLNLDIRGACMRSFSLAEFYADMQSQGYAFRRDDDGRVRVGLKDASKDVPLDLLYTDEELERMATPQGHEALREDERLNAYRKRLAVAMLPFQEDYTPFHEMVAASLCMLADGRRWEHPTLRPYAYRVLTHGVTVMGHMLRWGIRTAEQAESAKNASRADAREARRSLRELAAKPEETLKDDAERQRLHEVDAKGQWKADQFVAVLRLYHWCQELGLDHQGLVPRLMRVRERERNSQEGVDPTLVLGLKRTDERSAGWER